MRRRPQMDMIQEEFYVSGSTARRVGQPVKKLWCFGPEKASFESGHCAFLKAWSPVTHLTSLNYHFLICKLGTIMVPHRFVGRPVWDQVRDIFISLSKSEYSMNVSFYWFYSSPAVQAWASGGWRIPPTMVLHYSWSPHLEFIGVTPVNTRKGLKVGRAFWRKLVVPPGAREGQHTATSTEGPVLTRTLFL